MTVALTILILAVLAAVIFLPEPKPDEPVDMPKPEKGWGESE
jgi:hypothetical protein